MSAVERNIDRESSVSARDRYFLRKKLGLLVVLNCDLGTDENGKRLVLAGT